LAAIGVAGKPAPYKKIQIRRFVIRSGGAPPPRRPAMEPALPVRHDVNGSERQQTREKEAPQDEIERRMPLNDDPPVIRA